VRHPLNWLLRFGLSESDRHAILGDLEEEYRARVRPARSWLGAQAWYASQLAAATFAFTGRQTVMTPSPPRPIWRLFSTGDIRYALRRWRRRPGFPLTATLTLGLGIGAATAVFSVVDAVLLRPLPWRDADRLGVIHAVHPEQRSDPRFASTWDRSLVHYPAWQALRTASSFTDVAVWRPPSASMTIDDAKTELVEAMDVSSNFLPMLGVRVLHGRHFTREEDEREAWHVILSYEAWQRWFGGRPEVVGQPSSIAYASNTTTPPWVVVGVLEPGFAFEGSHPDVLRAIGRNTRSGPMLFFGQYRALGRLTPGVSLEAASAEASSLVQGSQPDVTQSARVVALLEEQTGSSKQALWLLFGAAGVLLMVACANVAGLLVGENRTRRHETAIRLALGGTRGGIVRQLVVEHLMLAISGAVAGLLLAAWLTQMLVALAPTELPRLDTVQIDWRVALFALGAGGATLLAFGIAPAVSLARTHAAGMLADGNRAAAPARHVAQRTVVTAQIAMAAVLVVGASLLGETLFRLVSQPLGFDPSNLVVVNTRFTGSDIPPDWIRGTRGQNLNSGPPLRERTEAVRVARAKAVVERLSALPGVTEATAIGSLPSLGSTPFVGVPIHLDGRPTDERYDAALQPITSGFTQTLRVPVLEGRDLEVTDGRTPALVSLEFARRYFPDGAVGRRFERLWSSPSIPPTPYEVIGVVGDLKYSTFSDDVQPTVYAFGAASRFVLRTAGSTDAVLPSIRAALAEVNPQIIVTATTTMEDELAAVIAAERFRATLSAAFAATALLLAAVGLYGVAARRVADRRRELGIRVALGARAANLRALVLCDSFFTVGLGLAVGLPASFAASQVTRAFLFGVSPTAPHVFIVASAILAAAALAATVLPARRASRTDPMLALRD